MSDDQLFIGIRDLLYFSFGKWSANKVYEIAHFYGYRKQRSLALRHIEEVCSGTALPSDKDFINRYGAPFRTSTQTGTRTSTVPVEITLSPLPPSLTLPPRNPSIPSSIPNGIAAKQRKKAADEAPTDWVEPMKKSVRGLFKRTIRTLVPGEIFTLAQLHAYRWANCIKSEKSNRSKARAIAAGIANLSTHKEYGDLTVQQYVTFGDAAWERGGKTPMYRAWDVTGAVERV